MENDQPTMSIMGDMTGVFALEGLAAWSLSPVTAPPPICPNKIMGIMGCLPSIRIYQLVIRISLAHSIASDTGLMLTSSNSHYLFCLVVWYMFYFP